MSLINTIAIYVVSGIVGVFFVLVLWRELKKAIKDIKGEEEENDQNKKMRW